MFDGAMIDVAIGMLLVFLVSSLFASAIVEVVAGILHRRSKNLWDTIDVMLGKAELGEEDGRLVDLVYRQPFVTTLVRPTARRLFEPDPAKADEDRVWLRGAVEVERSLTKPELKRRYYGPQYIPGRDFASSLVEVLRPGGTADKTNEQLVAKVAALDDGALKTQLGDVVGAAGDTMDNARKRIEDWYDGHMTSVSIWYRRQTRWFLFAAGLVLAVALNVDAVHTATTLYRDDEVRAAVVDQAEKIVGSGCVVDDDDANAQVDCIRGELNGAIQLPIGWGEDTDTTAGAWLLRALGWAAVAGSVTLGAPFWFDLLRRALVVKRSGSEAS